MTPPFLLAKLWIFFVETHRIKSCRENLFLVIKPKRKLFWSGEHTFLDIEKKLTKTKIQTKLIGFGIATAARSP